MTSVVWLRRVLAEGGLQARAQRRVDRPQRVPTDVGDHFDAACIACGSTESSDGRREAPGDAARDTSVSP